MNIEEITAYVRANHGKMAEAFRPTSSDRVMVILRFRMRLRGSEEHHLDLGPESDPAQIDALFATVEYCGCLDCRRLEFRPDMWWMR